MFSFHRPKVYRSSTGCCICKAKSSSSRFTDSKKYEEDFLECFQLATPRQGEICNACVLLVKRWKKLPAGTDRNWRHVVDARAGPGMKSMTKYKSKTKKPKEDDKIEKKKATFTREYSPALSDKSDGTQQDVEMNDVDFLCESGTSNRSSRTASPGGSDCDDNASTSSSSVNRRHKSAPKRREKLEEVSEFVDMDFWKIENVCCGMVFRGPSGELLIDERFLKPCNARLARCKLRETTTTTTANGTDLKADIEMGETSITKGYSDSSSDSGYDESSNQGVIFNGYSTTTTTHNNNNNTNTTINNNNNNVSKKDNNNDCLMDVVINNNENRKRDAEQKETAAGIN